MTTRYEVCPAAELPPGERKLVDAGVLSIGVFNVNGEYYAINNVCPHQLAPLCEGDMTGLVTADGTDPDTFNWERDGYIITCPWHNWEFDVTSGQSVFNPHKVKTRTYDVEVEAPDDDTDHAVEENGTDTSTENAPDCSSCSQKEEYGTALRGDEPPVETYDVEIEDQIVVLYI